MSERQKIKKEIYTEIDKVYINKDKLNRLNRELEKHPPQIELTSFYNFQRRVYERRSIKI